MQLTRSLVPGSSVDFLDQLIDLYNLRRWLTPPENDSENEQISWKKQNLGIFASISTFLTISFVLIN